MKKGLKKIGNIILLIAVILSDLFTPINTIFALTSDGKVEKGDVRLDSKISDDGSATISTGKLKEDGDVMVTKTITTDSKENGIYNVELKVEGLNRKSSNVSIKPIYVVVVFDTSGSMICDASHRDMRDNGYSYVVDNINDAHYIAADNVGIACYSSGKKSYKKDALTKDKWENAVNGAVDFSKSLASIDNTYISVVTYATVASSATSFKHGALTEADFSHPAGNTNLEQGIKNAKEALDLIGDEKAQKFILVIGDGEPTSYGANGYRDDNGNYNAINRAKQNANNAKNSGISIYAIGYGLGTGNSSAKNVLKYISSNTSVNRYNIEKYEDKGYYKEADSTGITDSLKTIFEDMRETNALTDAVLTDVIGDNFEYVDGSIVSSETSDGSDVIVSGNNVNINVGNVTSNNDKIYSFKIKLANSDNLDDGWYRTNGNDYENSYILTGKEIENNPIIEKRSAEVYWEKSNFNYTVNYYKDNWNNLIVSDDRIASRGTIINKDNALIDKYLNNSDLGTIGYEFNSINPESIVIDSANKVINILYTKINLNYKVEYYYDNNLDNTKNFDSEYGTNVSSSMHYLKDNEIRRGYVLDTELTHDNNYTIIDNNTVIKIYYKKATYNYTVKYYFNNNINNDLTKRESSEYNSVIYAINNHLGVMPYGYEDYFLDPNRYYENNESSIIISDNEDDNNLNIYYINTYFEEDKEQIEKTSNDTVTNINDVVTYNVKYNNVIKNVRKGDTIVVTIIDTLPDSISYNDSNLMGGIYDSNNNTITWKKIYTIDKYMEEFIIDEEFIYTVKYNHYEEFNNSVLINNVVGSTTIKHEGLNDKTTSSEDEEEVPVDIKYGDVIVYYVDNDGNEIAARSILDSALVGSKYETSAKNIFGYVLDNDKYPNNDKGKYIDGTIKVVYVYKKNSGNITFNEVTKLGPSKVNSINDTFNYTLTYKGRIENYIGNAKLIVTDKLSFEGEVTFSDKDVNRCKFEDNTITCEVLYNITDDTDIEEVFEVSVKYNNINTNIVTNSVNSKLILDNNSKDDDDKVDTEVKSGRVITHYIDIDGNDLSDTTMDSDLVGKKYKTISKDFDNYTLVEIRGDEEGYYTEEDIVVYYVYKTIGSGDIEVIPPQTGFNGNLFNGYLIVINILTLLFICYKNVEEK